LEFKPDHIVVITRSELELWKDLLHKMIALYPLYLLDHKIQQ